MCKPPWPGASPRPRSWAQVRARSRRRSASAPGRTSWETGARMARFRRADLCIDCVAVACSPGEWPGPPSAVHGCAGVSARCLWAASATWCLRKARPSGAWGQTGWRRCDAVLWCSTSLHARCACRAGAGRGGAGAGQGGAAGGAGAGRPGVRQGGASLSRSRSRCRRQACSLEVLLPRTRRCRRAPK